MRAPFTASGEATPDFVALLMLGRERGYLTPDDVIAVLEGVELRPELISLVIGRVTAEGIEWREAGELLSDEGLHELASEVVAVAKAERPPDKVPEQRTDLSSSRVAGALRACTGCCKRKPATLSATASA